jgi:RNA polymerase sigma factor for flagellar operon FliA
MQTDVKEIELQDLWRWYSDAGDQRARERLVVAYSPLVKYVAGRMSSGPSSHVEEGDFISSGLTGLIHAIEGFDLARGSEFETYAIPCIRGAIIDELRSLDWVPRSVCARAREIEDANGKLERTLHRAPSDEELAAELSIAVEDFQASLVEISSSSIAALDELWSISDACGEQVSLLGTLHDPEAPDRERIGAAAELKDRVADAIARLPKRERLVIALYYQANLTLREIGEVLGVPEARVSPLHTKAVLRLRSHLARD